jgi:hypothetical protein
MNTAVFEALRVTIIAMAGILLFKVVFSMIEVPGLSDMIRAV